MEFQVYIPVTAGAKCYQIFEGVVSQSTPRLDVMNVEILRRSAVLASPAVALEDLFAKFVVSLAIQSKARSLLTQRTHEAFCSLSRKVTFIGPGNSSNIRLIESSKLSFSLLSWVAPARKSAQIISKQ